jgi:hypothetical protein
MTGKPKGLMRNSKRRINVLQKKIKEYKLAVHGYNTQIKMCQEELILLMESRARREELEASKNRKKELGEFES